MIPQAAFEAQIAETAMDAAACCWSEGEESAGRETILLVEDETFVREVASEVLQSAGYRVLTAKNAAEAARTYDSQSGEVDLLLTDVVLPGESGRALAERLQQASPRLNVLLVTGYAKQMGLEGAGTVACLAKPFSVGVLLEKVREVLDREARPVSEAFSSSALAVVCGLQNLRDDLR
ncbi:MAG TPA: response regulator [Candidatus Acidoferrales bacterium]|nr:response regulator [Candidatus Acidoferrales bacterium]